MKTVSRLFLLLLLALTVPAWGGTNDLKTGAQETFEVPLRDPDYPTPNGRDEYGRYTIGDMITNAIRPVLDLIYSATGHGHTNATLGTAGFMSAADKTKLDGVAAGATANSTDAQLRDRATHTGAQAMSTVTGLQTALDGKAAVNGDGSIGADPGDGGRWALLGNTTPPTCDAAGVNRIHFLVGTGFQVCGPAEGGGYAWQEAGALGGGAWGEITGTLSAQTDLQNALNDKAAAAHVHGASAITYDNAVSGLAATDAQGAIDETKALIANLITAMTNHGVDTTPPSLTRVSPASATPAVTSDSLAISYTAADPQGLKETNPVTYTLDGGAPVVMTDAGGGSYTATLTGFDANQADPVVVTAENAAGMTTTDTIQVTYQTPVLALSPSSWDAGTLDVGTPSTPQHFTASNTGQAPGNLGTFAVSGTDSAMFALSNNTCGATLAGGANCGFDVTFTPGSAGAKTASVGDGTLAASLSGAGAAGPVALCDQDANGVNDYAFCTGWEEGSDALNTGATVESVWSSATVSPSRVASAFAEGSYAMQGVSGDYLTKHFGSQQTYLETTFAFTVTAENLSAAAAVMRLHEDGAGAGNLLSIYINDDANTSDSNILIFGHSKISGSEVLIGANQTIQLNTKYFVKGWYHKGVKAGWALYDSAGVELYSTGDVTGTYNYGANNLKLGAITGSGTTRRFDAVRVSTTEGGAAPYTP